MRREEPVGRNSEAYCADRPRWWRITLTLIRPTPTGHDTMRGDMADIRADVLIFGTGNFAARIALDLAVAASEPVTVAIAGRNVARLKWLETAGNARAAMFNRSARFISH